MNSLVLITISLFACSTLFAQQPYAVDMERFRVQDSINPPPANPIVFVGSSTFTGWRDIHESFPGKPILNRGFGGSMFGDLIMHVQQTVLQYRPKQVVVYCGDNDLTVVGASPQSVLVNFKLWYEEVRNALGDSVDISFVSIKPSPARIKWLADVKETNRLIANFLALDRHAHFIDVFELMVAADGTINGDLFVSDSVHMNAKGYERWTEAIAPYLNLNTLSLPTIFSSHMVVQRHKPIVVWGVGEPGQAVHVSLGDGEAHAMVQTDGTWRAYLPAQPAGGPFALHVQSNGESVMLDDVMVGEVWVTSGQSNMAMTLSSTSEAKTEIDQAMLPKIRMFQVTNGMSSAPLTDVKGSWIPCTPQTAGWFTAVGYYFAKELSAAQQVAVGIINTSWGGTPIEPWISAETMRSRPETRKAVLDAESANLDLQALYRQYLDDEQAFERADRGIHTGVHRPEYDDSSWRRASYPLGTFSLYGDSTSIYVPGCYIWFRNAFQVGRPDRDAELSFVGAIGELMLFVNGEQVDIEQRGEGWRTASIPKSALRPGKNVVALRLRSMWGEGTLGDRPDQVSLTIGGKRVAFGETWAHHARVEPRYPDLPRQRNNPAALYNAMVAPLIPYTIRGFLWYQGEANTWRPADYRFLFPMLISDWRTRWEQGYLPFLFVQLPNFAGNVLAPVDDSWAFLREAQAEALQLPSTGMAITIDIGDAEDIHPKNKRDVGLRLYQAARHVAYGESVAHSGPLYSRMEVADASIVLHFDHCDGGLVADGDTVTGFQVAGADGVFVDADARIDGDTVHVGHPDIGKPAAVRYGWAPNPHCNLYNGAGLPASPFRTDR